MKYFFIVLVLIGLAAPEALAQHRAGFNGAAFLKVGVGAREVAIGSAATSLANDANQIFWNPAGTALRVDQQLSVALSHNSWIADLALNSAAIGYNIENIGTITAGIQMFGINDIPANRQVGYDDPTLQDLVTDQMTTPTFDYQDIALSLSFSRYLLDRLSLGATTKFIRQGIDDQSASGIAFDFGSVYHIGVYGWQIAARLNNLGTPLQFYNQSNELPLTFSIGTSIYPLNTEQTRLMLALDAVKPQDAEQLLFGGAELSFYDLLFLRGGYKFNYGGISDAGTADRDPIRTSVEDFSLGAGVQYDIGGYGIGIDYAFTKMELLNHTHQISLRITL